MIYVKTMNINEIIFFFLFFFFFNINVKDLKEILNSLVERKSFNILMKRYIEIITVCICTYI